MGFWNRLLSGIGNDLAPTHDRQFRALSSIDIADPALRAFMSGRPTASGKSVNEQSALANATFFRAVNLIASSVGMLPLNLMKQDGAGGAVKASEHAVHRLLRKQPNSWQTPLQFKAYMQGRAILHGNAYAYKVPGVQGVQALIPLDPCKVTAELSDDWRMTYKWERSKGGPRTLQQNEVFHLRAPWSSDGITGDALLKVAAEALGLAELTDEAAARLLRNGAYVGGVLKHPKTLSKDAIERLKEQFRERFEGAENAGRWMVAEEGLDPHPFGMSGKDAEGLAQRKHQAEEISRYTGVPRPLLMFDETSWGTGIEQLGLFLITYCLMPWFVAWEEVIAQSLLTERERETHYAKFNEAALLRGSLKDQAEFLAKALGGPGTTGFMVPNEAREKMDMGPKPGGDQPNWGVASTTQPQGAADA